MLNDLRKQIIRMAYLSKEGHIPSALSILEIVWVLYDQILNISPEYPANLHRDRFVLSKGHGCLALYTVLAQKGFPFVKDSLGSFAKYGSILGGHPDRIKVAGIEASTGSLGHGVAISVGIAMSLKMLKLEKPKVYCIVGDGELNEGSVWESVLLASQYNLGNLCWIIDYNHSTDRALEITALASKFLSFGWFVAGVDGHSLLDLKQALKFQNVDCPRVIIANTIKGKGVSFMENNPEWHHKIPNQDEYQKAMFELS